MSFRSIGLLLEMLIIL